MSRNLSHTPPLLVVIAVTLVICAAVWLLACISKHGIAFLIGGFVLCVILKFLKDITT